MLISARNKRAEEVAVRVWSLEISCAFKVKLGRASSEGASGGSCCFLAIRATNWTLKVGGRTSGAGEKEKVHTGQAVSAAPALIHYFPLVAQ